MSFVGKPQTFLDATIANDGFWPDINLGDFQKVYRVPAEYTQELVEHHTRLAMSDCNQQLLAKKTEWTTLGFSTLDEVDQDQGGIDGDLLLQYQRAVFCRAMGLMILAFKTLQRREQAENLAKEGADTHQDYFAQSGRAIRRFLGLPENVSVELI